MIHLPLAAMLPLFFCLLYNMTEWGKTNWFWPQWRWVKCKYLKINCKSSIVLSVGLCFLRWCELSFVCAFAWVLRLGTICSVIICFKGYWVQLWFQIYVCKEALSCKLISKEAHPEEEVWWAQWVTPHLKSCKDMV